MRRASSAECPGQPSASRVLGQGRRSRSVIREEDLGHAENGREGGVHAVGCERDFRRLRDRGLFIPEKSVVTASSETPANTTNKRKEKKTHAGPKMEQDPKQKDTNTQKDTAKGHAGLLPQIWFV